MLRDSDDSEISEMVEDREMFDEQIVCTDCHLFSFKSYLVCRFCGGPVKNRKYKLPDVDDDDRIESLYDFCGMIQKIRPPKCPYLCGEPNMVNPNSYVTIAGVLRSLGHRAGKILIPLLVFPLTLPKESKGNFANFTQNH